ncbi:MULTISPECIES: hypothetical protein, partial [Kitasatospora]|uniref:hypothetical protein n=1 Tax=Kitasatospora TaxID=2063 RepID=UPI002473309A
HPLGDQSEDGEHEDREADEDEIEHELHQLLQGLVGRWLPWRRLAAPAEDRPEQETSCFRRDGDS